MLIIPHIGDPYTDAVDAITTGRGGRTATTGQNSYEWYSVPSVFRSRLRYLCSERGYNEHGQCTISNSHFTHDHSNYNKFEL